MASQNKELSKNVIIFGIGTFGAKIMQMLLIPLYTVYMTTNGYGVSDLVNSTISLISPLLMIGIGGGVLRYVLGQQENEKSVLKLGISICLLSSLVVFLFTPLINKIELFEGFGWFIPILYCVNSFKNVLSQFCKAINRNAIYAADGVISTVTLTLFSILFLAVFKMGPFGYLLATTISKLLSVIYFAIMCPVVPTLKGSHIDIDLSKKVIAYSFPLTFNELSWWIIQMSDRYMIAYFCSQSLNGVYSMAYKIPGIFNLVVGIFIQAFGITAIKECDNSRLKNGKYDGSYFSKLLEYYMGITFLFVGIIIFVCRPLAYFFIKGDFYQCWIYIPLLLCAYSIGNLESYYGSIYSGVKKSTVVMRSTVTGMIVNVILNLILIPRLEAIGAAIATIVGYFVVYLIRVINITKYVEMDTMFVKCIISIILTFIIGAFYMIGNTLSIFIAGIAYLFIIIFYRTTLLKILIMINTKLTKAH